MLNRSLSQQEKRLLVITGIVCCVYALYLAVYVPFRKKEAFLDKKIRLAEQRLSRSSNTLQQSDLLEQRYKPMLENFRQTGTDEQAMSGLLAQIESAANQANMSISDLKPRRVKTVDFYKNFSVSVLTEGQLKDIVKLINTLQSAPYFLNVDEMQISKVPNETKLRSQLVFSKIVVSDKK